MIMTIKMIQVARSCRRPQDTESARRLKIKLDSVTSVRPMLFRAIRGFSALRFANTHKQILHEFMFLCFVKERLSVGLRVRLHGRGAFDPVTLFVYTAPIETDIETESFLKRFRR